MPSLQREHLPAALVPLGLQGSICVQSLPEAPLLPMENRWGTTKGGAFGVSGEKVLFR